MSAVSTKNLVILSTVFALNGCGDVGVGTQEERRQAAEEKRTQRLTKENELEAAQVEHLEEMGFDVHGDKIKVRAASQRHLRTCYDAKEKEVPGIYKICFVPGSTAISSSFYTGPKILDCGNE